MSHYVAFPTHLLDELLAFLPPNERPVYAERFERIVGDLVWVQADAENAVRAALPHEEASGAFVWQPDAAVCHELTQRLMDLSNDALTALVQEGLVTMAFDLVAERQRTNNTVFSPSPVCSDPDV